MSYASRVRGTSSPKKTTPAASFLAGLSGLQVTLELVSGDCYEGVLLQKSSPSTYCLGQVQLVSKDSTGPNLNRFEEERSFDAGQVACMRVQHESKADRDEPQSAFKTDAEVRLKKDEKPMRNLEKWDAGDDGGASMSLDQEAKLRPDHRGWDQFKVNEKLFGYQSSYVEDEYTISIDRKSEFYRQNEPKARKVAAEIQNEASDNVHIAEERGHQVSHELDEESRFSTVLDQSKPEVYRPPALRKQSPEKDRSLKTASSSTDRDSSKRGKSYRETESLPSSTSPVKNAAAGYSSPSKDHRPANQHSSRSRSKSPQKPESVNGHYEDEKRPESSGDENKKFQFNAGAKEFVPMTAAPGLYFADGSYMPVIDSGMIPPMTVYPAYPFNPYYSQQFSPMGFVNQPAMFPSYLGYQAQQGQNQNRTRPQTRAPKPNQPQNKQQSNTMDPNTGS